MNSEAMTEPMRPTNHLANERSLYLKQHARNPIDWHPWSNEALDRARKEDKPIFLSIGYASCHWCHVMEHEVFEKEDIAAFMNEHFISIKVDREERPDLDATYMQAVQMMTGGGGWPMSVFLTPDLQPFFGGTYFPHAGFVELTRRILEVFKTRREEVDRQAAMVASSIRSSLDGAPAGDFDQRLLDAAVREAQGSYDRAWGGFRTRMKFPTPIRWHYLLRRFRKTGDENIAEMVRGTLDHMAAGGIRDHLGGGFHRYTVDNVWLVPHFEKMLYDNAQLASLYLEAGIVFGDDGYVEVARETLDFLLREMRDPNGGIYASFDADSGGDEGSYYVWTVDELVDVAGAQDGKLLAALLGATERGNFEEKNVLWRNTPIEQVAAENATTVDRVRACFDRHRPALLEHRSKRTPPTLDAKVVTAWNGLAIQALARAGSALDDKRYVDAARQAGDYLWRTHRTSDGLLMRASNDGIAANDAILDDYGALAVAFLDLHQATGDVVYISRAQALIDFVVARFSRDKGGFFLTSVDVPSPLGRRFDPFDNVEPSGNSMVLEALHRLAMLTGRADYRDAVKSSLDAMANVMERAGLEMAGWLTVGQGFLGPSYEIVVAGDPDDDAARELQRIIRGAQASHVSLVAVPASGPDDETTTLLAPTSEKLAVDGAATAYVCTFGTCRAPTGDPKELRAQMMEGWSR
jgi:uncharacterized protein